MLNSLLFVVRRRYFLLQPRAEIIMQNGNVVRRTRKMHSDIWQFRWREKTTDGKTIYRRRQIGTVDQIPDMDTARKAAGLLVPDLNARAAKSKPVCDDHLLNTLEKRWHRVQGDAGAAPTLDHPINPGRLHASNHTCQTECTSRGDVVGLPFSVKPETIYKDAADFGCKLGAKCTAPLS